MIHNVIYDTFTKQGIDFKLKNRTRKVQTVDEKKV